MTAISAAALARLYDYSSWANQRILAACRQLSPDEFTQSVAGSYGSVRNTFVHTLSAEWGWLERCGGPPRGARLVAEDFPTLESVAEVWGRVETSMRAYLAGLDDASAAEEVTFTLGAGPAQTATRGDLLTHVVVHAVHHRGQVSLLIRELGYAPGNVDFLIYLAEGQAAAG